MRVRPVLSAILLAAYLPACTSYQATTQPLAELTATPKPPEHLRVTTTSGAKFVVDAPRVVNDSIFGTTVMVDSKGTPTTKAVALPLADISTVEVQKSDGSTALFIAVGVSAIVALAVAASCSGDSFVC